MPQSYYLIASGVAVGSTGPGIGAAGGTLRRVLGAFAAYPIIRVFTKCLTLVSRRRAFVGCGSSRDISVTARHAQIRRKNAKKVWELAGDSMRKVVRLTTKPHKYTQEVRSVRVKKIELSRLGRRIRLARELLGLTQDSFAIKCGLDRSYLGGVERGDRNLTFGVLCATCEGLSCDIAAVTKGIPHLYT